MKFFKRFFKIIWILILLLAVLILIFISDSRKISNIETIVSGYKYSIIRWELNNFPDKWINKFKYLGNTSSDIGITALCDYIETNEGDQNYVEEVLESLISNVLVEEKFARLGTFVFPPVDTKLKRAPNLLVISPRNQIERVQEILLSAEIPLSVIENIENKLLLEEDLSGLVIGLGGLATYPSSIADMQSLEDILTTVAHEWMHHYLFFHPLGRAIYDNEEMMILNESISTIIGNEIGTKVWAKISNNENCISQPKEQKEQKENTSFNFSDVMKETRQTVETYLQDGQIEEAEIYMDNQRKEFVRNGYSIRKINQAYFSFYGTYADRPESVSPIYKYLLEIRNESSSLREFLDLLEDISSYEEFLKIYEDIVNPL